MKKINYLWAVLAMAGCQAQTQKLNLKPKAGKAVAVFAEGCFWCSEHVFEAILGVDEAVSGYSGGHVKNPTYQEVGGEETGHAESVAVFYDPKIVSYAELVDAFFASQDPTTPNQQGPDRGPSYRSIAFYGNPTEKKIIEDKIKALTAAKAYPKPIVTEIKPVTVFYEAESYHQDYVERNPNQSYVRAVSLPRFNLFKKNFKKLKK
ncbi:MAG: peptide-methionine (S)-S-oxide reductase [Bacteroidota bacterium]|nr:peptide-methionine (S)-S-oxide reductase [Bacteroidota bacterium]